MGFVFYDTETTGISTSFDQILQFAAIYVDAELNELDRIDIRCRLHPHVVPHPGALRVTGMTIAEVTDGGLSNSLRNDENRSRKAARMVTGDICRL